MATVTILTHYNENYGSHDWDGTGTCPQQWKRKGKHSFIVELDSDLIIYARNLDEICRNFCISQSSEYQEFNYQGHDVAFVPPTLVDADYFIKNLE